MRRSSYVFLALALCIMLACLSCLTLAAHAEDYVPVSEPVSVLVTDPDVSSRLDAMQQTLDAIAAALGPEEEEDAEPEPTPSPAPDYTDQLDKIESVLTKIDENTTPATPEPPVSALEKPFEEYTTSEVLLLCIGVVIVFVSVGLVFLRR